MSVAPAYWKNVAASFTSSSWRCPRCGFGIKCSGGDRLEVGEELLKLVALHEGNVLTRRGKPLKPECPKLQKVKP